MRATPCGSLLQHRGGGGGLWRDGALDQHQRLRTTHGQSFQSVTRLGLWLPATYKVILLIFAFCMLRRHIPLPELNNGGKAREPYSAGYSGRLDRIVMIDANGRLGEAPTPLLGNSCWPDFDDNGYSLLDFMHHWDMEAPATFEPLPLSTWTSRGGKKHEIDFVLIPSAWHDLVQWNSVIPRVALALQGQEDHRLLANQVAFQPKPVVVAAPSTFYSRDALINPETVQKIHQFYDGVPAIPPERDAASAVDLFSKLARIVLGSFAPPFCPRAASTLDYRADLDGPTTATSGQTDTFCHSTTEPPQTPVFDVFSLAQTQTGPPTTRLRPSSSMCPL